MDEWNEVFAAAAIENGDIDGFFAHSERANQTEEAADGDLQLLLPLTP